ncbi:hypothetical protein PUR61_12295 [Streptomyces sp. BE20]|nr:MULTISPECIES: hypothetical protein [unclassified Streptomyces]MED7948855.1 hypothetical protein [Streptomyces sp. BE303]MEE1822965.1 hypothetical protein [Streptomyces sp. BE20]
MNVAVGEPVRYSRIAADRRLAAAVAAFTAVATLALAGSLRPAAPTAR